MDCTNDLVKYLSQSFNIDRENFVQNFRNSNKLGARLFKTSEYEKLDIKLSRRIIYKGDFTAMKNF